MPTMKVKLPEDVYAKVTVLAEKAWPGHGMRGVGRFLRDALRRYLKYCDDGYAGHRSRRSDT
jgi:hypothetical protein